MKQILTRVEDMQTQQEEIMQLIRELNHVSPDMAVLRKGCSMLCMLAVLCNCRLYWR